MSNPAVSFSIPLSSSKAEVLKVIESINAVFGFTPVGSTEVSIVETPATPQAQVTPAQVSAAELDADGIPYDERIHSGGKTKTAAGVWTKRKNLAAGVYEAVYAELRALYPKSTPTQVTAPAQVAPGAPVAPPLAVAPVAPPAAVAPPVVAKTPYEKLVDWLATNTGEGKRLTPQWVNDTLASQGQSVASLATNQELAAAWLQSFEDVAAQIAAGG